MDCYSFKKRREVGQKDIDKKLVSEPDATSMSGVIYPYVSFK